MIPGNAAIWKRKAVKTLLHRSQKAGSIIDYIAEEHSQINVFAPCQFFDDRPPGKIQFPGIVHLRVANQGYSQGPSASMLHSPAAGNAGSSTRKAEKESQCQGNDIVDHNQLSGRIQIDI